MNTACKDVLHIYSRIMPTPVMSAIATDAPTWKNPNETLEWTALAALLLDEELEDPLEPESAVAVASVVTVPVPAVPASLICEEQVPVAAVVALVLAEPPQLQALAALFSAE